MEKQSRVNNSFYEELGDGWYDDTAHPIALLRAENATRNPWIQETIKTHLGTASYDILDIGCGAGFLSNVLGAAGHRVIGIDISAKSLAVAKKMDTSKSVCYRQLDASSLPFSTQSFDVIAAMDVLEHIENPSAIVQEAARLLRPNGLFFFHTFNRHWLSYLIVIKAVEWCVPNTPSNMHIYSYFIKPQELKKWCTDSQLAVIEMRGLVPQIISMATLKSLIQRKVDKKMKFRFSSSLTTGYLGVAKKQ